MGYRRVNAETLHEILQRLRAGDSNRRLPSRLGLDRKTVNQYVARIEEVVVPHGLGYQETLALLAACSAKTESPNLRMLPWSRGRRRYGR